MLDSQWNEEVDKLAFSEATKAEGRLRKEGPDQKEEV